jgi:hypothetical protein
LVWFQSGVSDSITPSDPYFATPICNFDSSFLKKSTDSQWYAVVQVGGSLDLVYICCFLLKVMLKAL